MSDMIDRYFENLIHERNQSAWESFAKDVEKNTRKPAVADLGTIPHVEPEPEPEVEQSTGGVWDGWTRQFSQKLDDHLNGH